MYISWCLSFRTCQNSGRSLGNFTLANGSGGERESASQKLKGEPFHVWQRLTKYRSTMIYLIEIETVCFFRLFTREGYMENTGCGNTEHRGLKARVLPGLPSCPDYSSLRKGAGEHDLHCDGSLKGPATPRVGQKCSAASYCKLQELSLFLIFCDVNHQCQAVSELCVLCGMESRPMPLPASWIYASYLF